MTKLRRLMIYYEVIFTPHSVIFRKFFGNLAIFLNFQFYRFAVKKKKKCRTKNEISWLSNNFLLFIKKQKEIPKKRQQWQRSVRNWSSWATAPAGKLAFWSSSPKTNSRKSTSPPSLKTTWRISKSTAARWVTFISRRFMARPRSRQEGLKVAWLLSGVSAFTVGGTASQMIYEKCAW